VDITRDFIFRHAGVKYHGIPIIASNMDTTGTFEMARALDAFHLSTALHKHYSIEDSVAFFRSLERKSAAFYSMGITKADEQKFQRVMDAGTDAVEYVCIDVANVTTRISSPLSRASARSYPRLVIHGRQCRDRRDDGGTHSLIGRRTSSRWASAPGSVCTTRKMTRRRLSAVVGCHRVRGRRPRPVGAHLRGWRLLHARRCRQGVRRAAPICS